MLKYRELKEKNKIKTCICTSLLPTCGQGEDKLVLCVTTYGRNADTTRETYKSACGNVKCKHFIVPTALLDQRNGQRHMQTDGDAQTSSGDGKCQCKVSPLPSPLFAFHAE